MKKVEWNLLLFLAATLVMGEALLDSGAAAALAGSAMAALPLERLGTAGVLVVVTLISLMSHLVITSRTARALVLIPIVALPLAATGLNPALLILLAVVGSGFCQTLAVSAKPVALFARAEVSTYSDGDLLRLALWLFIPLALGLLGCAALLWPALGLPLSATVRFV